MIHQPILQAIDSLERNGISLSEHLQFGHAAKNELKFTENLTGRMFVGETNSSDQLEGYGIKY